MHKYLPLVGSALLLGCPPEIASDDGDGGTSSGGIDSLSSTGMTTAMQDTGTGMPDTGGGSGMGTDEECTMSAECGDGLCVAPFDRADGKGAFVCVSECVDNFDSTRWCSDDASCCDGTATCTAVGLCDGGAATGTDGGMTDDGTTSDGTTDGTDGGSTDSGSTGAGSSSESGSESGSSSTN